MSLVNLAHICSHLQNASLARLGLTSIPYTRLHLSLSLLLQKQGFLSQVKLAGPSPPASCFPPGARDNHHTSSHPHSERGTHTPEHALQRAVRGGEAVNAESLRREGYGDEAVGFALANRIKTKAQLERDGWAEVAADFILKYDGRSREEVQQQELDSTALSILEQHAPMIEDCKAQVLKHHSDRQLFDAQEAEAAHLSLRAATPYETHIRQKLRETIIRTGFDLPTLQYFAGPTASLISARELAHDGITISAMGLDIPNQPFIPPAPAHFADPYDLETEGVVTQANRASRRLWLGLKYWDGMPVLTKARLVSKPTKRIWLGYKELGRLVRGSNAGEVKPLSQVGEVMAVSTDRGVMEVRECVERRVGGLPLCRVW